MGAQTLRSSDGKLPSLSMAVFGIGVHAVNSPYQRTIVLFGKKNSSEINGVIGETW